MEVADERIAVLVAERAEVRHPRERPRLADLLELAAKRDERARHLVVGRRGGRAVGESGRGKRGEGGDGEELLVRRIRGFMPSKTGRRRDR
jgi:hypothetical protein